MFLSIKLTQDYTSPRGSSTHCCPPAKTMSAQAIMGLHCVGAKSHQAFTHGTLLSRPHRQDNRSMQLLHRPLTLYSQQEQHSLTPVPGSTPMGTTQTKAHCPRHTHTSSSELPYIKIISSHLHKHHLESRY